MAYYKWFANRRPIYGTGMYVLDGSWQPRIEGEIEVCTRGYHVCRDQDLAYWRGTELAEVEIDLEGMIDDGEKVVVRSWRLVRWLAWDRKDMIDCARADAANASNAAANAASDYANAAAAANSSNAAYAALASANAANASANAASARYASDYAANAASYASSALASERERQKNWILNRVKANEAKGGE